MFRTSHLFITPHYLLLMQCKGLVKKVYSDAKMEGKK